VSSNTTSGVTTKGPHQILTDNGEWVQIARTTGAECGEDGVDDDAHAWSCSRLKNHDGAHVACLFHETGRKAGQPESVIWMWPKETDDAR
jgi:hypothetical protein